MFTFTILLTLGVVRRDFVRGKLPKPIQRTSSRSSRIQILDLGWGNPFSDIMEGLSAKHVSEGLGVCPCCGFVGRLKKKRHIDSGRTRANAKCPVCGASERHRVCCLELAKLLPVKHKSRLLHFGPQLQMENQISHMVQVDQISMDFFQTTSRGQYKYSDNTVFGDVTNLSLPNSFVDGIILLHVLEHVVNLTSGLAELHRVLKIDGWMILEVPCSADMQKHRFCGGNSTFSERVKCAGQNDHYWRLSCNEFLQQTEEAGFSCRSSLCSEWNDTKFRTHHLHRVDDPREREVNDPSICGKVHHRGFSLHCVKSATFTN